MRRAPADLIWSRADCARTGVAAAATRPRASSSFGNFICISIFDRSSVGAPELSRKLRHPETAFNHLDGCFSLVRHGDSALLDFARSRADACPIWFRHALP